MSAIDLLKDIVANQKTISTSRLAPILKEIETMYIQQGKKIQGQSREFGKLNAKYIKLKGRILNENNFAHRN